MDHNDGCDNNWVSVQVRVLLAQQFLVFMVMVCMVRPEKNAKVISFCQNTKIIVDQLNIRVA